jgi:CubicO group peptidase (beta-lactamase class C family)
MTKKRALLLTLLFCLPLHSATDKFEPARNLIRQQLVQNHVPSIAVAVAQHGHIIWEEGFGWANREQRIPATEHTMYSLASISKPFTATGLMTLVEAGKIDLDRPINDYLGDAKLIARVGDAKDATVRRVANHTSGLPLHYHFFYPDEPWKKPSMDETILRYGNLIVAPGEKFEYSNLGFGIIDYVLQRTSGESYPDFMREAVFEPLGLTHTSVNVGPGLEKFQAQRYTDDGTPVLFYDFDHVGGSALFSSAHDLVRFGMFHLKDHLADQKQILSDAAIEETHRSTAVASPRGGYGIGWFINDRPDGYHTVTHSGSMLGVYTYLLLVPSEDIAVVVLSNCGHYARTEIYDEIMKALLPRWKKTDPEPDEQFAKFQPDASLVGTWKGALHTYQSDLPLTLQIFNSGEIHAKLGDQLVSLVNDVTFKDGYLSGQMLGDLGTDDVNRHRPYQLLLSLKLRGNVLNGGISALSSDRERDYYALTHWTELKKQ